MRDAQSLLDQMIAFFLHGDGGVVTGEQVLSLFGLTDKGELDNLVGSMLRNDPAGVITIVAKLAKKGKNLETLFEELLGAIRAVELCSLLPQPELVLDETPEAVAEYRQLGTLAPNSDVVRILLEQLAPAGRVLRDALDRQIVLETLILKAMREAHAVRIDDILRRLNQLRTAGELKFLEKLPAVESPLPIPGALTANIQVAPVAAPAVEPTPVAEAVSAVVPEPVAEAVSAVEPTPVVEAVSAVVPEPTEVASAVVPEPVAEVASAVVPEPVAEAVVAVVPEPVAEAVSAVAAEEKIVSPAAEESAASGDEKSVVSQGENLESATIGSSEFGESDDVQQAPDRKVRHSVLAHNPDAMRRIVYEDPKVAEVVELFNGTVIDMHVM